jgi:hypothetical protein
VNTERAESRLLSQVRETDAALKSAHVDYMIVGGVAVNAHGVLRATHDLDVMIRSEDSDALDGVLKTLGYSPVDRRPDLAHYIRTDGMRLDVLYSRRPITARLLDHADLAHYSDVDVPIVSIEGLIGLKVQSFTDDPRRLRDLEDIMRLMKTNRDKLDMAEIEGYFDLFERRKLLDDVLRAIG